MALKRLCGGVVHLEWKCQRLPANWGKHRHCLEGRQGSMPTCEGVEGRSTAAPVAISFFHTPAPRMVGGFCVGAIFSASSAPQDMQVAICVSAKQPFCCSACRFLGYTCLPEG